MWLSFAASFHRILLLKRPSRVEFSNYFSCNKPIGLFYYYYVHLNDYKWDLSFCQLRLWHNEVFFFEKKMKVKNGKNINFFFCFVDSHGEIQTNQMAEIKCKIEGSDRNNNLCYSSDNKTVYYCFSSLSSTSLSFLYSFFFRLSSFALFCSLLVFFYCFVLWLRHITMCALYKLPCPVSCFTLFIVCIIFFSFVQSCSKHSIVICREVDIFSVKIVVYTMTCSMLNPIFNHFLCNWIVFHPTAVILLLLLFFKQRLNVKLLHLQGKTVEQSKIAHIRWNQRRESVTYIKG